MTLQRLYIQDSPSKHPENSYHFILHVSTNDLYLDSSPELIAKFIIDLALTLKIRKIKLQHVNEGKLHLNQKVSFLGSDTLTKKFAYIYLIDNLIGKIHSQVLWNETFISHLSGKN